jgi:hypothetical protein
LAPLRKPRRLREPDALAVEITNDLKVALEQFAAIATGLSSESKT